MNKFKSFLLVLTVLLSLSLVFSLNMETINSHDGDHFCFKIVQENVLKQKNYEIKLSVCNDSKVKMIIPFSYSSFYDKREGFPKFSTLFYNSSSNELTTLRSPSKMPVLVTEVEYIELRPGAEFERTIDLYKLYGDLIVSHDKVMVKYSYEPIILDKSKIVKIKNAFIPHGNEIAKTDVESRKDVILYDNILTGNFVSNSIAVNFPSMVKN